jgi:hypothetical protein
MAGREGVPVLPATPPRGDSARSMAEAVADGSLDAAVMAAELARLWRDHRPETMAFWRSALAELRTGILTADLVVSLVADASRKGVTLRSRQFSKALGSELRARRAKNRPPGTLSTTPAAGERTSPP